MEGETLGDLAEVIMRPVHLSRALLSFIAVVEEEADAEDLEVDEGQTLFN